MGPQARGGYGYINEYETAGSGGRRMQRLYGGATEIMEFMDAAWPRASAQAQGQAGPRYR